MSEQTKIEYYSDLINSMFNMIDLNGSYEMQLDKITVCNSNTKDEISFNFPKRFYNQYKISSFDSSKNKTYSLTTYRESKLLKQLIKWFKQEWIFNLIC